MANQLISRRNFIRGAAVGAAAVSGIAAAQDYFPPGDGETPNGEYVRILGDRVMVFPSGDGDADYIHLDDALNNPAYPNNIFLMDKSINNQAMNFLLPDCDQCDGYYGMEITRDVKIFGQGNGTTIEGGYIALKSYGNYSLSISKLNFKNQIFAAIIGSFKDFGLVSSGVDPLPPPSPDYDFGFGMIMDISGSLNITNTDFRNTQVGLFCQGISNGGKITSSKFWSSQCGIFISGRDLDVSGTEITIPSGGLSNILLEGESVRDNRLSGIKYLGMPGIANIVIWEGVMNTKINLGLGSRVASGVDPLPPPKPSILDIGIGSDIKGPAIIFNEGNVYADAIASLSESIRSLLNFEESHE